MKEISQRELRNDSGTIMRGLDAGESYVVTRNGQPVGQLLPLRRQRFVKRAVLREVFSEVPPMDPSAVRADLDRVVDQDVEPRA